MNWTLEVVVVPVADVDRAKAFYAEQLGFEVDHDTKVGEGRVVAAHAPRVGLLDRHRAGDRPGHAAGGAEGPAARVADLNAAR
jgi:catechol 2,3-dioxygenase-like lactoylglutathione lyase family enzyme